MNPEVKLLYYLQKIIRSYLDMTLYQIWSTTSLVWSVAVMLAGALMAVHEIFLISVLFTSGLFRRTRKQPFADHRAKCVDPSNGGSMYLDFRAFDRSSVLKGL
jgi:hypothetical protein